MRTTRSTSTTTITIMATITIMVTLTEGMQRITVGGTVFAVLTMAAAGHEIDASDIDTLQALCEIGSLALENARKYQSAVEQSEQIR